MGIPGDLSFFQIEESHALQVVVSHEANVKVVVEEVYQLARDDAGYVIVMPQMIVGMVMPDGKVWEAAHEDGSVQLVMGNEKLTFGFSAGGGGVLTTPTPEGVT